MIPASPHFDRFMSRDLVVRPHLTRSIFLDNLGKGHSRKLSERSDSRQLVIQILSLGIAHMIVNDLLNGLSG